MVKVSTTSETWRCPPCRERMSSCASPGSIVAVSNASSLTQRRHRPAPGVRPLGMARAERPRRTRLRAARRAPAPGDRSSRCAGGGHRHHRPALLRRGTGVPRPTSRSGAGRPADRPGGHHRDRYQIVPLSPDPRRQPKPGMNHQPQRGPTCERNVGQDSLTWPRDRRVALGTTGADCPGTDP